MHEYPDSFDARYDATVLRMLSNFYFENRGLEQFLKDKKDTFLIPGFYEIPFRVYQTTVNKFRLINRIIWNRF